MAKPTKRKIVITGAIIAVLVGILVLAFATVPKLDASRIDRLTITTLPSPPQQKVLTDKKDIQKVVDAFNSLSLVPCIPIGNPAGSSVWFDTEGDRYIYHVNTAGNHTVGFGWRAYYTSQNAVEVLQAVYQKLDVPETPYHPG